MSYQNVHFRLLIGAAAICFLASPGWGLSGDPPLVRYMASGPKMKPIWIDAQAATAVGGDIDWELFDEGDKDLFSDPPNTDPETGECLSFFGEPISERIEPKPNETIDDLRRYSKAIYSGVIAEIRPGFFNGVPYTLARFQVTTRYRNSAEISPDQIEVPIPYANFSIGSKRFCTNGTMGYRPRIGDRAILFLYDSAVDAGRSLVVPKFAETIFEDNSGKLYFDGGLSRKTGWLSTASLEDVENFLATEASGSLP